MRDKIGFFQKLSNRQKNFFQFISNLPTILWTSEFEFISVASFSPFSLVKNHDGNLGFAYDLPQFSTVPHS